jgi:D-alanyl-D-alanine carboxypeptidase (penicillin-binding protein 5/6)
MNAETGHVLYNKEAHAPSFPASTTKIATALFLLDAKQVDLDRVVTVSQQALRQKPNGAIEPPYYITADSSLMGLTKGDLMSLEDLLHGLLLSSGNDAANVLAEVVSGSVQVFMHEFNAYIQKMGWTRTFFVNPHGYHHPEHKTTAYELGLMAQKALQFPKFREIVAKTVYKTSQKPQLELKQRNQLMRQGDHFYPKAIGVKTGFHNKAQSSLVAAAVDQGRTLIAVVLGAPTSDDRYRDARTLFEAAFAEEKVESVLVTQGQVYQKSLEGAKCVLVASVATPLIISFYPAETPRVKGFVHWDSIVLPLQPGQKVGHIAVVDDQGRELGRQDLWAQNKVPRTFGFVLKSFWKRVFK